KQTTTGSDPQALPNPLTKLVARVKEKFKSSSKYEITTADLDEKSSDTGGVTAGDPETMLKTPERPSNDAAKEKLDAFLKEKEIEHTALQQAAREYTDQLLSEGMTYNQVYADPRSKEFQEKLERIEKLETTAKLNYMIEKYPGVFDKSPDGLTTAKKLVLKYLTPDSIVIRNQSKEFLDMENGTVSGIKGVADRHPLDDPYKISVDKTKPPGTLLGRTMHVGDETTIGELHQKGEETLFTMIVDPESAKELIKQKGTGYSGGAIISAPLREYLVRGAKLYGDPISATGNATLISLPKGTKVPVDIYDGETGKLIRGAGK
ncbi:hypothetical protein ACPUER_36550, partial [Burkholderia sp. DN3021]|uniref:hypothetical protein n=1 Tax=Burkholderia sp. DN3021 TaxID=3410137 RepID=UPI003C7C4DF2